MGRVLTGAAFVHLTAADGKSHLIQLHLYERDLMNGQGRYLALCGRTVLAGSMCAAPDHECALCRAIANSH